MPIIENILTTEKVISIPGTYNQGSGMNDYLTENQIKAEVIEVIPEEGVYYDNYEGYSPNNIHGYTYLYYDESGSVSWPPEKSKIFIGTLLRFTASETHNKIETIVRRTRKHFQIHLCKRNILERKEEIKYKTHNKERYYYL